MIFEMNESSKEWPGILIRLSEIVDRLSLNEVSFWSFKKTFLKSKDKIFGLNAVDFNLLTETLNLGIIITHEEFRTFLHLDWDVEEGSFIALSANLHEEPLFVLSCFDSSYWQFTSTNKKMIEKYSSANFDNSALYVKS